MIRKYIKIPFKNKNTIVIFSDLLSHSYVSGLFSLPVISAGFISLDSPTKAHCFGKSVTLETLSEKGDSELASSLISGLFTTNFIKSGGSIETIMVFDKDLNNKLDFPHSFNSDFLGAGYSSKLKWKKDNEGNESIEPSSPSLAIKNRVDAHDLDFLIDFYGEKRI